MNEIKKIENRNKMFLNKKTYDLLNERTSYSLKLRKEKLNEKIMKNRFKIDHEEKNLDNHLKIREEDLDLKDEFILNFKDSDDKIGILMNLLLKSIDKNNIKFAINYLRCLTQDITSLTLLKEYLNSILEKCLKKFEVTWIILNITEAIENTSSIFNRNNLEILTNLLENSKETPVKENILCIFNNILIDVQSYDFLIILIPSFPSILKRLLLQEKEEKYIKYKQELIKTIYQVCKFSVELIHTKFCDEEIILTMLKFIQIGSYFSLGFLSDSLDLVNLLIRSENENILQLFLDNKLVSILLNLFNQNLDINEESIIINIDITKILCNVLNGKASQVENVLSSGLIPFYENYLTKLVSLDERLKNDTYISLIGDIIFLFSNIVAGTQNQCDKVILHSKIPTIILEIYPKLINHDIIYEFSYFFYCSIAIGSKMSRNKIFFELPSFEFIHFCLNQNRDIINCSLNFLTNSVNLMKNNSSNFQKVLEKLENHQIVERLNSIQHDKNTEISAKAFNILNLIWEYDENIK